MPKISQYWPSRRTVTSLLWNIAIFIAVYSGVQWYQQRGVASGRAPSLQGVNLTGEPLALQHYRGRPVVVHFWATWCGVCRLEQGNIDAVAGDYPLIAVASHSGQAADIADYVRDHGIIAQVLPDSEGRLAAQWGVRAFPTTFIIDAHGLIRHVSVGYTSEAGLRTRLLLSLM